MRCLWVRIMQMLVSVLLVVLLLFMQVLTLLLLVIVFVISLLIRGIPILRGGTGIAPGPPVVN